MEITPSDMAAMLDGNRFQHGSFLRALDDRPRLPWRVEVSPSRVFAGRYCQITLCFHIDETPLQTGARVVIKSGQWLGGNRHKYNAKTYQTRDPKADAYVRAATSGGVGLAVAIRGKGEDRFCHDMICVTNTGAHLKRGESLTVVIGDQAASRGILAQEYSAHERFFVAIDPTGKGGFGKITPDPTVEFIGNDASRLVGYAPATPDAGDSSRVTIAAVDSVHNNPDYHYDGAVHVSWEGDGMERHIFPGDHGIAAVDVPSFAAGDIHRVIVRDSERKPIGMSNPIVPEFLPDGYRAFFGDMHGHNEECDGGGSLEDYFRWGRDVLNLDFCAVSPHSDQRHTRVFWTPDTKSA